MPARRRHPRSSGVTRENREYRTMAKREIVTYIDDLDESEAAGNVEFGIDGRTYEIDLSEANAGKLREALAPFVAAGRRITGGKRAKASAAATASTVPDREQSRAKRDWARANGFNVPERGRLRADIEEAYANRNGRGGTVSPIRPAAPAPAPEAKPAPTPPAEEEAPAKPLDDKGKAAAVAAAKAPKKGKPDTALQTAAKKATAAKATKTAAKAGKLPGVRVKALTAAQTAAIEDFKLSTYEVGTTIAIFKGATPADVLAEIQAALKTFSGEKTGGAYRALTSVVRKLQKADPNHVAVVEVDASAA